MTSEKVSLREAQWDERDLSGIWELCRRLFENYRTCTLNDFREIVRHRWLDNPWRRPGHVMGWVLDSPKDGIVGFVGLIPVGMKVGPHEVVGACGTAFVVTPAYRAYSISLYRKFVAWGDHQLLLDVTSGPVGNKLHATLKLGIKKIPVAGLQERFLWMIRPEMVLLWRLGSTRWKSWVRWIERGPVAWIVALLSRARFFRHRRVRFAGAGLPVERVKEFTDEFTQFWEDHKQAYGVAAIRTRAYLQWRYMDPPRFMGAATVLACRGNGRLLGYVAVMKRLQTVWAAPGRYVVTDLFYDKTRPDVLAGLMNGAFDFAKSEGGSVLEVSIMSPDLRERLRSQRPYIPPLVESWPYWYKAPTQELAGLCEAESWWPSGADGDANL
ncbi:MAG: hypothetical protein E8D45_05880 [Nitrospira sp.]|nr:MAG: hypothetical protein E8D45_05880 [Nitrospira sp.]